jgi:hypothetical protein
MTPSSIWKKNVFTNFLDLFDEELQVNRNGSFIVEFG